MTTDIVSDLAQRYAFSEGAVTCILKALEATGGTEATFDHPELGGAGSWTPATCLVGERGDSNLRHRVAGLTTELAAILRGSESATPRALFRDAHKSAASSRVDLAAGESWWPESYGHPEHSAEKHGMRFAYFPQRQRLLVQLAGRIDAFDTAGRQITGCHADQTTSNKVSFVCPDGPLQLDDLKRVPV